MADIGIDGIADWCSRQQLALSEKSSEYARKVFVHLIEISPKSSTSSGHSGRYIANWRIGKSIEEISQTEDTDPTREATESKIESFITDDYFLLNPSVVIYNTADYHIKVEDEGWSITKAYAPVFNTINWAVAEDIIKGE